MFFIKEAVGYTLVSANLSQSWYHLISICIKKKNWWRCFFVFVDLQLYFNFILKMSLGNSEIKTYFGRCRCCLNYSYLKSMWEEHIWQGEKEVYVEMLIQCFALTVSIYHCSTSTFVLNHKLLKLKFSFSDILSMFNHPRSQSD